MDIGFHYFFALSLGILFWSAIFLVCTDVLQTMCNALQASAMCRANCIFDSFPSCNRIIFVCKNRRIWTLNQKNRQWFEWKIMKPIWKYAQCTHDQTNSNKKKTKSNNTLDRLQAGTYMRSVCGNIESLLWCVVYSTERKKINYCNEITMCSEM